MKEKFILILAQQGFRQVTKKVNYVVFKHPDITILYIRLYRERFTLAMYADTEEFQYKEELYSEFKFNKETFLFDLLKDNNDIRERVQEENNRVKEENKNKKNFKFEK